MVVGVLRVELRLEAVRSLKEKRGLVQKILARCRNRFPVSAAEVGDQDLWGNAVLGFAMVSSSEPLVAGHLERLEDEIESSGLAEIVSAEVEYIHL
ncbi:MAG: DUF503 domain-containing protein [Deltaproteobacteria bacterium]|nr:MAG: DUF503 domain-containing protein [Deltaproteobacteria bacterium]